MKPDYFNIYNCETSQNEIYRYSDITDWGVVCLELIIIVTKKGEWLWIESVKHQIDSIAWYFSFIE
jgi:hypothetical protein